MNVLQQTVYRRAAAALDNDIKREKENIQFWQFLDSNYPHTADGEDATDGGITRAIVQESVIRTKNTWKLLISRRQFVEYDVEIMVTNIYDQMSDVHMTYSKIKNIANLIHKFMQLTGDPWILLMEKPQWKAYLIGRWGRNMIPHSREDVWTMIPSIGRSFLHELNYAQNAGHPLPKKYPDYLCMLKYEYQSGEYGDLINHF